VTRLQHLLYVLGAWRFKGYRRWIGGLWRERFIEATPHSSERDCWRWEPCMRFDSGGPARTYAFESWPIRPTELPIARAIATRDRKSD
jgi:hypothetical protein